MAEQMGLSEIFHRRLGRTRPENNHKLAGPQTPHPRLDFSVIGLCQQPHTHTLHIIAIITLENINADVSIKSLTFNFRRSPRRMR